VFTYRYRIRDSSSKVRLKKLASSVNFVWNYVNKLSFENIKQHGRFLSTYDVNYYLNGCSKGLEIGSSSIQEIARFYVQTRQQFKKRKLSWRSAKRSLGWVPLRHDGFKLKNDTVRYCGHDFKLWKHRELPQGAKIKTGSFVQDARDRWYLNVSFEVPDVEVHALPRTEVGIDLGIKNQLTLSTGENFTRGSETKKFAVDLAHAQRARKKKRMKAVSAKAANRRSDWTHKVTTDIVRRFATVFVGDLKTSELVAKSSLSNFSSLYDASIGSIKHCLKYKAKKLGGACYVVNEAYTSVTCYFCEARSGPTGKGGLAIREWTCQSCGAVHHRDVNAARNILRRGHSTLQRSLIGGDATLSTSA